MQIKQSEITNYLPSLYNRNNQEVNHKLAADFYRSNLSPRIDNNHHQYQQILSPTLKSIDITRKRNTINYNLHKFNSPIFKTGLSPSSKINQQSVHHKWQNLSFNKNNRLFDPNSNQRQGLNHCVSTQRIRCYNSPQNLFKNFQYGMMKNTDNVQKSINIFNNSPNKTYTTQHKNNPFYSIQTGNQMITMNQANPENVRFCQSAIINNIDSNLNKVIQPKVMAIIPNLSVSNFSDLQTTASSVNLSSDLNTNSNLSLHGTPKKPQFYANQRRNQEICKSTALLGNSKSKYSHNIARLNTKYSQVLKKIQSKRKQFTKKNFIPQKMENLQKINEIEVNTTNNQQFEVNITNNQQLNKSNDLNFRKKDDQKFSNNNIVDLKESKDNLNQKYSNRTFSIQDFQIIQKLGRGSFGEVFLVIQKNTKFVCVLKALSKKKIKQQKLEQLVFRQIKIQSYLVHKHITSLYGVFDDLNKIYLIMQCMPDSNLASNGKKKITENQTAHLVLQVLAGLQYMHRQGILHRDIKPQNLFLNHTYLKIGDFGCAVFGDTLRRTVVGCYAYISPEQFENHPYDQKIDVWSVGILTYELLTGKPPYEQKLRKIATKNYIQIQNMNYQNIEQGPKIQFSQLDFPKDLKISEQAIDFIKRLLDPDPQTRSDIKEALKHKFLLKKKQYDKYLQTKL